MVNQKLGNYHFANDYCTQALAIATELQLPLAQECQDLMKQLPNND
ncbi:MAG: hypothetical protein F6J98_41455 [Moorea sp. SIO4G2]|nr:hypothetical protein [Moorena sp. SIO4G2]